LVYPSAGTGFENGFKIGEREPKIGTSPMQTRRSTLADVAQRAGVSKATASRVLGGSQDRVSSRLTERVVQAATELNYVPNPHAQALARASSPSVALIVHDIDDPYFSEIARGALSAAARHERLVMIGATFRDPEREVAYVREMRAQQIHAILLAGSSRRGFALGGGLATELASYHEEGGRVALMMAGHGYPAVVPDNLAGGRMAAEHLMGLGHEAIAVIAGPREIASVSDRLAGFEEALADAGIRAPAVVCSDFTRDGGEKAAARLLGEHADVTAILALNDPMAVGAIRHLVASGRTVPGDVSVMGYDDVPIAADLTPTLTTIRVPMAEMGAAAMDLALTADPEQEPDTITFETALVVRESTGVAP
jgi:LacI family transcriptional regulator